MPIYKGSNGLFNGLYLYRSGVMVGQISDRQTITSTYMYEVFSLSNQYSLQTICLASPYTNLLMELPVKNEKCFVVIVVDLNACADCLVLLSGRSTGACHMVL